MELTRTLVRVAAVAVGMLLSAAPVAAENILLEVAVTDGPYSTVSAKRVSIPVGEATEIEATERYKLAVTPVVIKDSGEVRLEISVRDISGSLRTKAFSAAKFGTPVQVVRGKTGEQSVEVVAWSR